MRTDKSVFLLTDEKKRYVWNSVRSVIVLGLIGMAFGGLSPYVAAGGLAAVAAGPSWLFMRAWLDSIARGEL